jgi:hypothetical protein
MSRALVIATPGAVRLGARLVDLLGRRAAQAVVHVPKAVAEVASRRRPVPTVWWRPAAARPSGGQDHRARCELPILAAPTTGLRIRSDASGNEEGGASYGQGTRPAPHHRLRSDLTSVCLLRERRPP